VFRLTVDYMRNDEALSKAVRTWQVWDGGDINSILRPPISAMTPLIRMDPTLAPMNWHSSDAQQGFLVVKIRTIIQTTDADDYLNLWDAIDASLYPYGQRSRQLLFQQELADLGCEPQQWEFSTPAATPMGIDDSGMFNCDGLMRINIVRAFNP
jgi:hypothetical protein